MFALFVQNHLFFVDFMNCFTHGRMKYSCLKVVDPEGKNKAKKADILHEVSDFCQFVTDEDYRNYFTSVHTPLENAREKYEKQKHDRILEYFEVRNRKNPSPKPYYDEVTFCRTAVRTGASTHRNLATGGQHPSSQ